MAQQLLKLHPTCCSAAQLRGHGRRRAAVVVRAEGKVVREFREDDNTIVESAKQAAPKDIYIQDIKIKQKSFSKEYRSKLMDEYVGLGGAENRAMSQNWFLYVIVIVSSLAVACKMIGAL